jgi:hypothetical protein
VFRNALIDAQLANIIGRGLAYSGRRLGCSGSGYKASTVFSELFLDIQCIHGGDRRIDKTDASEFVRHGEMCDVVGNKDLTPISFEHKDGWYLIDENLKVVCIRDGFVMPI